MGLFKLIKDIVDNKGTEQNNDNKANSQETDSYLEDLKQREELIKLFDEKLFSLQEYEIRVDNTFVPIDCDFSYYDISYSNITKNTDLKKISHFVVIDTETTGLSPTCGLVELSAIRFDNNKPTMKFNTFIKPKAKTWTKAEEIHHISPDMVKDAPTIEEVANSFIEFVGNYDIVGHNLEFDLAILEDKGIIFGKKHKYFDTLKIAKKHLKKPSYNYYDRSDYLDVLSKLDSDVSNYKLETLCEYYGIYRNDAHRSDSDCFATGYLLLNLYDDIVNG